MPLCSALAPAVPHAQAVPEGLLQACAPPQLGRADRPQHLRCADDTGGSERLRHSPQVTRLGSQEA